MDTEGTPATLTAEDCATLRGYFTLKQHEFLNSNAYITEAAITTRIEDVDPAWTFEILNISNRDAQVTALGRLTIKGVSRDGIGMAKIAMTRDGKGEANEAEKSAATDALKRAARLFGIGRYLLDMENVTDASSLTRWFNQQQNPPTLNVVKTDTGAKVDVPNGADSNGQRRMATAKTQSYESIKDWGISMIHDASHHGAIYENAFELSGALNIQIGKGVMSKKSTYEEALAAAISYKISPGEQKPTGT